MGFGYDSRSDDYKVFRVVYINFFYDEVPTVQVYSTEGDIWRDFKAPIWKNKDRTNNGVSSNTIVKGVMYIDSTRDELISFDFSTEVFEIIPFPCSVKKQVASHVLGFEDFVAMAYYVSDGSRTGIELWALDDACTEVSWNKRFIVDAEIGTNGLFLCCYLGAGVLLSNGGNHTKGNIFVHDCDEKKERNCYVLGGLSDYGSLKYTENLVSLDGFEQLE